MDRILTLFSLIVTCGISLTDANRGRADDCTHPGYTQNLRTPINPAGLGDCAFNRGTHFIVLSDRVVDRDENDNEDDFRRGQRTAPNLRAASGLDFADDISPRHLHHSPGRANVANSPSLLSDLESIGPRPPRVVVLVVPRDRALAPA